MRTIILKVGQVNLELSHEYNSKSFLAGQNILPTELRFDERRERQIRCPTFQ